MSATDEILGYGATLEVSNAASPTDFTAIAKLATIKPGKMTRSVVDKTHLTSPNTHREKRPGIKDTAAFTITGAYLPLDTTQGSTGKGLAELYNSGETAHFRVTVPDGVGTTYLGPFTGFVSGLDIGDFAVDKDVMFTAEITPDTQITLP
jgi:hypothetical protein